MTVHVLSAGDGYQYLTRQVATGDATRDGSELSTYYVESGYPPGRWLGTGLAGLNDGQGLSGAVSAEQMAHLFGTGSDPVTGQALGQRYQLPTPCDDRVATKVAGLSSSLDEAQRSAAIAQLEAEETVRRVPRPVAGFDCVFTPVKSVSVLWALAGDDVRQAVHDAHHAAIEATLAYMEREVIRTRAGRRGIAQLDTRGLIAAAFDHWDSRPVVDPDGTHTDPNLHTHLVIANRVQGPDGKWRTVDSRALHHAAVACSERYNALLADELTRRLGVRFTLRDTGRGRHPVREIDGIGPALIREFSSRRTQIDTLLHDMVERFRRERGREPSTTERIRLAQQATLTDRASKQPAHPSLSTLLAQWRQRAVAADGRTPPTIVRRATGHRVTTRQATEFGSTELDQLAVQVRDAVAHRRATWTRWHIDAEATRRTADRPMASAADRDHLVRAVSDRALDESLSLSLSADPAVPEPDALRRADGQSVFRRHNSARYTSRALLNAERRLVAAAHQRDAPSVPPLHIATAIERTQTASGRLLSPDQSGAVHAIATSRRVVDALIGPAGTGKTTTMRTLAEAWQASHGAGSVLLLAPSAAAARVLVDAVQERGDNLAKWLYESVGEGAQRRQTGLRSLDRRLRQLTGPARAHAWTMRAQLIADQLHWSVQPGQLVIVDEASLAGTFALDQMLTQVQNAGAKLLLTGDPAQLSAVEAGGALRLIAHDAGAVELSTVWRFHQPWEAAASLALRAGDRTILDTYADHGRIVDGPHDAMTDAAYQRWRTDETHGQLSLLIAADNATVAALNTRARAERQAAGIVETLGVPLHDGTNAGVGDRVVTRRNERTLPTRGGHDFVKNGDLWTVDTRHPDGALTVRHARHRDRVRLPGDYVATHVELGYATTAHRGQGMTVDTAHLIATDTLSRELLYVGLTRGAKCNTAYVSTEPVLDPSFDQPPTPSRTARDVLTEILGRIGAEQSATETARAAHETERAVRTLADRYDYAAEHDRDRDIDNYLRQTADTIRTITAHRPRSIPAVAPITASTPDRQTAPSRGQP